MEDVLTEPPPPSRFFPDDLDAFAAPSPPLPPPLLRFSPNYNNPNPRLLLVAISAPSVSLLRRLPAMPLAGTLLLPSLPRDHSAPLYSLGPALLADLHSAVPADRAVTFAKALLAAVNPERVVVLDSLRGGNFRGRLAADDPLAFKLETSAERRSGKQAVEAIAYLPSGSVADGLGAAVLAECQVRRMKGTLVLTWPDRGWASPAPVLKRVMGDLGVDVSGIGSEEFDSSLNSSLYT